MDQAIDIKNIARLQWACRRGMLELDVLLGNFLQNHFGSLSVEDKKRFANLLNEDDPSLLSWLMGREEPADEDLNRIVGIIRSHGKY